MAREAKYPWNKWFDGNEYLLKNGIDFEGSAKSFQNQIYVAASRKGKQVTVEVDLDEQVIIIKPRNAITLADKRAQNVSIVSGGENGGNEDNDNDGDGNSNSAIVTAFQRNYPLIAGWFADLERGYSEIEINVPARDEKGKVIYKKDSVESILKHELVMEKRKEKVDIREEVVLQYPNDIPCSPKKAAVIIRNEAIARGYEADKWYYDFSKKDKLIIQCGSLAESSRTNLELKEFEKQSNLARRYEQKDLIPLSEDKIGEWFSRLKDEENVTLIKGQDFIESSEYVSALINFMSQQDVYKNIVTLGSCRPDGARYVIMSLRKWDLAGELNPLKGSLSRISHEEDRQKREEYFEERREKFKIVEQPNERLLEQNRDSDTDTDTEAKLRLQLEEAKNLEDYDAIKYLEKRLEDCKNLENK